MTKWAGTKQVGKTNFPCGFCGCVVGPSTGYEHERDAKVILICPNCDRPTYFENTTKQTPAPLLGNKVENLPQENLLEIILNYNLRLIFDNKTDFKLILAMVL